MKAKLLISLFFMIVFAYQVSAQMIGSNAGHHTIVVKGNGTVYTWGYNYFGQLGNRSYTDSPIPVQVYTGGAMAGKTITTVASGFHHSIARASDGTVFTWGRDNAGQLGDGNPSSDVWAPVSVSLSGITQVAAGYEHSLALASNGTIYAWGNGSEGRLGDRSTSTRYSPVTVYAGGVLNAKTVTRVAAGNYHSLARTADGKVYAWGYNWQGQLGNQSNTASNEPVAVLTGIGSAIADGTNITQIAAGEYFSVALASDGKVYTWGMNTSGQLGNGSRIHSNVPVAVYTEGVLNGKYIIQVAAGQQHCVALASDGTVYTWGFNRFGQLGVGTSGFGTDRDVPVAVYAGGVLSGKNIVQVAAGYEQSFALASDGTMFAWGRNDLGQLGDNSTTMRTEPVYVYQNTIGPLPVELSLFSASVNGRNVDLRWETATEMMNYGFEVERKMKYDIGGWQKIGFVQGNGNSNSVKRYSFTDAGISAVVWQYRLKQLDTDGSFEYSKIVEVDFGAPSEFALNQNYPNPFNPSTTISFSVPVGGYVSLAIFNLLGEKVAEPINKALDAGNYTVDFDASGLSSGLYFYTLKAGEYTAVKKMVLTK